MSTEPRWTMPTPHRLDELSADACGTCHGLGFVWLSQKYRCRVCAGTGLSAIEDAETEAGKMKDAA